MPCARAIALFAIDALACLILSAWWFCRETLGPPTEEYRPRTPILAALAALGLVVALGSYATAGAAAKPGVQSLSAGSAKRTGSLTVTVIAAKGSAAAKVTVRGPRGKSWKLSRTRKLTGLKPGTYRIKAATLTGSGWTATAKVSPRKVRITTKSKRKNVKVTYRSVPQAPDADPTPDPEEQTGQDTETNPENDDGSAGTPLSGIRRVSAGAFHSCAVLSDGSATCWGRNSSGQIGDGSETFSQQTPATVADLNDVSEIAAGEGHSCALASGGRALCWGAGSYGQLGYGPIERPFGREALDKQRIPVPVDGLLGIRQIDSGNRHSCALVSGGRVLCWGLNYYGELGDGSGQMAQAAVSVTGVSNATQIATGGGHSCALVEGGRVMCWGSNANGQLGDGTRTDRATPVTVGGLSGATLIVAGGNFSCALVAGGRAMCWGSNDMGQLGDGTTADHLTPGPVNELSGATEITAGLKHACALHSDGQTVCWGFNGWGQLGDGSSTRRLTPTTVGGLGNATQIDAGGAHTCALVSSGQAKCWGLNFYGQLGNGSRSRDMVTSVAKPVAVVAP